MKKWFTGSALVFIVLVLAFFGLRWLASARFQFEPEPIPPVTLETDTPLYQALSTPLNRAGPENSLFLSMGNAHLALLTRMELARQATRTLDLQYYLFHDDDAGRALLAALVEAADRGIRVRLLLDDMDMAGGRDRLFLRLMQEHPNLSIRIFNPLYYRSLRVLDFVVRFPNSSRRMHNKSFTADGIVTAVGGRNIGNEYFEVNTETGFVDLDVLAAGPVATEVTQAFNAYWYSGLALGLEQFSTPADDAGYTPWFTALSGVLREYRAEMEKRQVDQIISRLARDSGGVFSGKGLVIYDEPHKVLSGLLDDSGWLYPEISKLMRSSQKELMIVSPYFIPGHQGTAMLGELVRRGVKVTILTNSFAANDVVAVHSGYIDYRHQLLKAGVSLYELKATRSEAQAHDYSFLGSQHSSLHAKTFMIDRKRTFVGSFNLDPRSAVHNTEMGVVFDNADYCEIAYHQGQELVEKEAYEVRLTPAGKLQWVDRQTENGRTIEVVHDTEPDTTWYGRLLVYLISWLPVEWLL
ncbi:MAG TPA: phospholipase D family protein [Thiolinea sp.]|nr:phospholipase D family protein [Thiolinea sp.]